MKTEHLKTEHLKNRISLLIIIALLIICFTTSVLAYNYYEEYNRVQDELVELACSQTKLENTYKTQIETYEQELIDTKLEVTALQTKPIYEYKTYSVPVGHNSFRSWMPSSAININSKQGQYLKIANSDNDGLLKINDCYCVALGTYYGEIGDIFKVTTSTGSIFRVIKIDVKSNSHTDKNCQYTISNNCMMEFIVDRNKLNTKIKSSGCVNTNIISGDIIKIEKESIVK